MRPILIIPSPSFIVLVTHVVYFCLRQRYVYKMFQFFIKYVRLTPF